MQPYFIHSNGLTIYKGDTLETLKTLKSESVNCIVTSPPYWGLRNYGEAGQYGLEPTIEEHISNMVEVFSELRRILTKDGTCWLNYGDTYLRQQGRGFNGNKRLDDTNRNISVKSPFPDGNILGVPWMLAFALRADGWILRQEIIWYKPNPMPESIKNRCTKAHEHLFLLTKSNKYFFEPMKELRVSESRRAIYGSKGTPILNTGRRIDPRRDPLVMGSKGTPNNRNTGVRDKGDNNKFRNSGKYTNHKSFDNSTPADAPESGNKPAATAYRNRHSVWTVATRGFNSPEGEHFATFPLELIRPCISSGCPVGGTALDPFMGTGTVGEAALNEGINFIGIDLSGDYCNIAINRLKDIQKPWFSFLVSDE